MPVKSAPKKIKIKEVVSPVSSVPIELEEPEAVVGLEEKTEDEAVATEEEAAEELGLDYSGLEEELDPFNDKWEA